MKKMMVLLGCVVVLATVFTVVGNASAGSVSDANPFLGNWQWESDEGINANYEFRENGKLIISVTLPDELNGGYLQNRSGYNLNEPFQYFVQPAEKGKYILCVFPEKGGLGTEFIVTVKNNQMEITQRRTIKIAFGTVGKMKESITYIDGQPELLVRR